MMICLQSNLTEREYQESRGGMEVVKINLKLLENAGYEHLYGISPVLNALEANHRNFANPDDEDEEDLNNLLELQKGYR